MARGTRTKGDADQWAEIAGEAQTKRDRAIQIIVNMQEYLRAMGRNFIAADEFIKEAKINGWAGLSNAEKRNISWNGLPRVDGGSGE